MRLHAGLSLQRLAQVFRGFGDGMEARLIEPMEAAG
jgi:hypothetical protein